MSLYFLLPLLLLGAAAATGFGTAWLFSGMQSELLGGEERLQLAVGLAVAIPVVAAVAVLIPRSNEFLNWYGEFLHGLWLWAAGAFGIGLVFGWAYCAQERE